MSVQMSDTAQDPQHEEYYDDGNSTPGKQESLPLTHTHIHTHLQTTSPPPPSQPSLTSTLPLPSPSTPTPSTLPFSPAPEIVVHESLRGLLRPAAAEFLGSALFVFICCGTGVTTVKYQIVGNVTIGIALTFGLTIFVLCYTIGHISGGHLNFAVTFTFCLLRKISILKAALYFLAQWLGGMVGIGFLVLITPDSWQKSCFANNVIHPELTVAHAFVVEFVLTFFLMFVVMAACDTNKSNQTLVPLAIGLAVFCAHMIALPIDGCSINPTRTFASAVAASGVATCNAWANHWVFWFGPIMGASMAGILYEYCFHEGGYKVDALIDMYIVKKQH